MIIRNARDYARVSVFLFVVVVVVFSYLLTGDDEFLNRFMNGVMYMIAPTVLGIIVMVSGGAKISDELYEFLFDVFLIVEYLAFLTGWFGITA